MRSVTSLTFLFLACWTSLVLGASKHYFKPDLKLVREKRHIRDLPRTLAKRVSNGWGLLDSSQTTYKNGIAVGFLPDFTVAGAVNTINGALAKPMSLIGDYVQIYTNEDTASPPLVQVNYHIANVSTGNPATQPVYVIALMPQDGFAAVTPAVINAIVVKMQGLNDQGITVWLRYAHEMNLPAGSSAYSGDAAAFIASWQALATAIYAGTDSTFMLWSPNVDTSATPNYEDYYPGNDYVDIAGLSLYSFAESSRTANDALTGSEFVTAFTPFYNIFSYLPITISETSKPYDYTLGGYPGSPAGGSAVGQEAATKLAWFEQITAAGLTGQFPSLIAVNWFEFLKDENGQTVDFRSLTGMSAVRSAVSAYLSS